MQPHGPATTLRHLTGTEHRPRGWGSRVSMVCCTPALSLSETFQVSTCPRVAASGETADVSGPFTPRATGWAAVVSGDPNQ